MKRSEILKLLIETNGAFDSWADQCEYMLKVIEEAGMRPPTRPNPAYSGWQSDYSGIPAMLSTWEAE